MRSIAARASASQLAGLYGISTSAAYGRIGLTTIAGQNDDNEYFSQSDAQTLESFAETPERWIDVSWDKDPDAGQLHTGRLNVVIANQTGSLGSLTTVIGKNDGNIMNLKIVNRSTDFFEILIDVEVKDVKHLTNIIAALRATPNINSVERARG